MAQPYKSALVASHRRMASPLLPSPSLSSPLLSSSRCERDHRSDRIVLCSVPDAHHTHTNTHTHTHTRTHAHTHEHTHTVCNAVDDIRTHTLWKGITVESGCVCVCLCVFVCVCVCVCGCGVLGGVT